MTNNLIGFTSMIFLLKMAKVSKYQCAHFQARMLYEQVKAWAIEKDAEALRCQKLLVEEEEAAKKRYSDKMFNWQVKYGFHLSYVLACLLFYAKPMFKEFLLY